jgi:hypothetical protein
LNPVSFEELSVHVSELADVVVALADRLVGAARAVYVSVPAIRERRAPLLVGADVRTAPISNDVPLPFVIDRPLNDVVARSTTLVLVKE